MFQKDILYIKELQKEINNGKGCIVFDFGCWASHIKRKKLTFNFQIDGMKMDPIRLDHRYPDRTYYTISKKNRWGCSRIGYPFFFDISEKQSIRLLTVNIGYEGKNVRFCIPIDIQLTKEQPVCGLSINIMAENAEDLTSYEEIQIRFRSWYIMEDGGWAAYEWRNISFPEEVYRHLSKEHIKFLAQPEKDEKQNILYYRNDILKPCPQRLEDLAIFS